LAERDKCKPVLLRRFHGHQLLKVKTFTFLVSGRDNGHLAPLVMFTKLLRIFVRCLEEENLELLEELRQELKQVEMRRPKQWRT
jgi:hypothetical protein